MEEERVGGTGAELLCFASVVPRVRTTPWRGFCSGRGRRLRRGPEPVVGARTAGWVDRGVDLQGVVLRLTTR